MEFTSTVTRFIKNCHHPTSYCTEYLSSFTHRDSISQPGEVLEHLCLVLELCTSDVDRLWAQFPNRAMPALLAKKILRDVLHGLSQFHALKCIHTGKTKPFTSRTELMFVRWKISKPGTFSARLLPSPQDRPCSLISKPTHSSSILLSKVYTPWFNQQNHNLYLPPTWLKHWVQHTSWGILAMVCSFLL